MEDPGLGGESVARLGHPDGVAAGKTLRVELADVVRGVEGP